MDGSPSARCVFFVSGIPEGFSAATKYHETKVAAVAAQGTTILRNAASEPHVQDLANFLIAMGAYAVGAVLLGAIARSDRRRMTDDGSRIEPASVVGHPSSAGR